jgi:Skp family chaperone for outer membrane proteins
MDFMRWKTIALVLAFVIPAFLLLGQTMLPPAEGQVAKEGLKIGVMDMGVIFKAHRLSKILEEKINREKDELKAEAQKREERLKTLGKELISMREAGVNPTGPKFVEKAQAYEAEAAKYEWFKKHTKKLLMEKKMEYQREITDDIERVAKAYGKQSGFALILNVQTKELQERDLPTYLQGVIYYSDAIDITQEIVQVLRKRDGVEKEPGKPEKKEK